MKADITARVPMLAKGGSFSLPEVRLINHSETAKQCYVALFEGKLSTTPRYTRARAFYGSDLVEHFDGSERVIKLRPGCTLVEVEL